jgi:AcrR family transcriptional regulator
MRHKPSSSAGRRTPTQDRSKRRVELILKTAAALIEEQGATQLKMASIAHRAQLPVGSIYQFFPSKESLLRELVVANHDRIRLRIEADFAEVSSIELFIKRMTRAIDDYFEFFFGSPAYRELWSTSQAWAPLQDFDRDDSLRNARVLARALSKLLPNHDPDLLLAACISYADFSGSIARYAHWIGPPMKDQMLRHFKEMVASDVRRLAQSGTSGRKRGAGAA